MTLKQLKKDIISKMNDFKNYEDNQYFSTKLFHYDETIYKRRSFNDLIKYYSQFNVSEKLLLQALYECGLRCGICNTTRLLVFFIWKEKTDDGITFTEGYTSPDSILDANNKYTRVYIKKLFKSIYDKKINEVTRKSIPEPSQ
jgi:hypothetical protein